MTIQAIIPLVIMGGAFLLIAIVAHTTGQGNLDHIKSKTVGDGQHGTARWATKKEIQQTFKHIPFRPEAWRKGKDLPTDQGLVLGCVGGGPDIGSLWATLFKQRKKAPERPAIQALVDTDDIHCLMIGASGIGKTAFFLYPNLEYACACGMSFLALDTKGDLARNYGTIATRCYGYQVAVIDLRNPTRSDPSTVRTPSSMTQPRACSPLWSCCWRSTCPRTRKPGQSSGTSSACSSWCRTSWCPVEPQKAKTVSKC